MNVERVLSIEDSLPWIERLSSHCADSRHQYIHASDGVYKCIPSIDINSFDLIFIDDSKTGPERIKTLESIVARGPKIPLVIHDYQYKGYQRAIGDYFSNSIIYDAIDSAHAALLWNGSSISPKEADFINDYLRNVVVGN